MQDFTDSRHRFDAAPHSSNESSLNEPTSARQTSATPGKAKHMRISSVYSPQVAAAAAPDVQSSEFRAAFSIANSKSKTQEVFDESGNAIPFDKNLPPPKPFTAQLLPGKLMQHPDGSITKKRQAMYA